VERRAAKDQDQHIISFSLMASTNEHDIEEGRVDSPPAPSHTHDVDSSAENIVMGNAAAIDEALPPTATVASLAMPPGNVEIVVDDSAPLPPVGTAQAILEATKRSENNNESSPHPAGIEQIHDNVGPAPSIAMMEDSTSDKRVALLEGLNELSPPFPFNVAACEDGDGILNKINADDDASSSNNRQMPTTAALNDSSRLVDRIEFEEDNPQNLFTVASPRIRNELPPGNVRNIVHAEHGENESIPRIPEAFLVEDEDNDVIISGYAEIIPPWWKQKLTRIFFAIICLVVAAAAVAVGVSISSDKSVTNLVTVAQASTAPSVSIKPTNEPITASPSSSFSPSYSPTTCTYKISANAMKLDMGLLTYPKVSVDGRSMVVVATDSESSTSVSILFYVLTKDRWESVNTFPMNYWGHDGINSYSVALSGKTAFVGFKHGFDMNGIVLIFEQSLAGGWVKTGEPPMPRGILSSVDIDGDIACVGSWDENYIFQHIGNEWVKTGKLNDGSPSGCSVAGNNVAITTWGGDLLLYKYDEDLNEVLPILDPIDAVGFVSILSSHYLVHAEANDSIIIYQRIERNQTFAFLQQLNISDYNGQALALDEDILVIGGYNHTYVFAEQNGYWEEAIKFDQPLADHWGYQISGRNLLATIGNMVYFYNIQKCTQSIPTQTPSISIAPTMCYGIEISVIYSTGTQIFDTSWELQRIDTFGNALVVKTYDALSGALHSESLCLSEGEYEFSIFDWAGFEGRYNVMSINGTLIAQGEDFGGRRTKRFSLPFVATSAAPFVSPAVSSSPK